MFPSSFASMSGYPLAKSFVLEILCINIFNYILNIDLRFEFKVYSFVDERDSDILHLETSS